MFPQKTTIPPHSRCPPPFLPHRAIPGSMIFMLHLTRDSTNQRVCSPGPHGAGFNPPEFLSPCGLPVSCCLATSVVRSRNSKRLVAPPRRGPRRGPHGLPSPRIFIVLEGMKAALKFVLSPSRDLGVRGASIVQCGLSCLVDLNSDLYRLCGSLHGPVTFWARRLS